MPTPRTVPGVWNGSRFVTALEQAKEAIAVAPAPKPAPIPKPAVLRIVPRLAISPRALALQRMAADPHLTFYDAIQQAREDAALKPGETIADALTRLNVTH